MSKLKSQEYYKKLQGNTKIEFPYAIKMNHKTLEDVKELIDCIFKLVNSQAEDEVLWFKATNASEAYVQQELRKLHQIIEDKLTELEKLKL